VIASRVCKLWAFNVARVTHAGRTMQILIESYTIYKFPRCFNSLRTCTRAFVFQLSPPDSQKQRAVQTHFGAFVSSHMMHIRFIHMCMCDLRVYGRCTCFRHVFATRLTLVIARVRVGVQTRDACACALVTPSYHTDTLSVGVFTCSCVRIVCL